MIAHEMGYPGGVMKLVLALTFTGVGAQNCNQQELINSCVSPYQERLLSLTGTFCNKELFTQDICNDVNEVFRCLTRYNVSPRCFADNLSARVNFSCAMSDFKEKCSTTSFTESVKTDFTTASTFMGTTTLRTTPSSTRETPSTTTTSTGGNLGTGATSVAQVFMFLLVKLIFILNLEL